ncbi:hypothetical protein BDB00DRAFT_968202 [Zychaea mexicana]|uniref:uncharacterized protein n=1 Tax=Zychaea mexicana TaxID=64656 RepID=UPI0022FDDD94|nr:uncharacterized protein BDB00DRAFT_968202 [Zychaea mexicana]KAI9498533.1 hypothetical protein BDB00DRAFT_968202 [Zychaea mexicana]
MIDGHELPIVYPPIYCELNDNKEFKTYGGYITNNIKNFNPLIRSKRFTGSNIKFINKMTIKIVNYMSSIGFNINLKVLDFLMNLPLNDDLIIRTLHKETDEMSEIIKKNNKEKEFEITSHNSKFLYNNSILTIAKLYRDVEQFYFTFFLD